ncbi:MAG: helix-turn-helix domain-containing protein [candidate division Zixibacteria bacterium]|nr:helix-turn-helix domain-containing protein [candidate division Zixibacteria bacterium]
MNDSLLSPQQVADMLCVKLSTIYHWTHTRQIPCVKLGRLIRFRRSRVVKWIERRERKGRFKRTPRLDILEQ